MILRFLKKNWVYVVLISLIVALNVLPRPGRKEEEKTATRVKAEEPGLFMEFEDAKLRTAKIENTLKDNPSLYLFYIFLNAAIVFIFLLGLVMDGYFIFGKIKRKNFFQKTGNTDPPPWTLGDVFKIVVWPSRQPMSCLCCTGFS